MHWQLLVTQHSRSMRSSHCLLPAGLLLQQLCILGSGIPPKSKLWHCSLRTDYEGINLHNSPWCILYMVYTSYNNRYRSRVNIVHLMYCIYSGISDFEQLLQGLHGQNHSGESRSSHRSQDLRSTHPTLANRALQVWCWRHI